MPAITLSQYLLAFLLQTLIYVFFCWSLYKTLLHVRETNRAMSAGLVWLLLVPGLSTIWNFVVVWTTSTSLNKEFTDRDFEIEKRPGLIYGMIYACLSILPSILVIIIPSAILAAGFLNVIGLVFFVMYWVKINWYRKVLEDDVADDSEDESL